MLAGLVSPETFLLGLQMATFILCFRVVFPPGVCALISSYEGPSHNLITSLKTLYPNAVPFWVLGVITSTYQLCVRGHSSSHYSYHFLPWLFFPCMLCKTFHYTLLRERAGHCTLWWADPNLSLRPQKPPHWVRPWCLPLLALQLCCVVPLCSSSCLFTSLGYTLPPPSWAPVWGLHNVPCWYRWWHISAD